MIKDQLVLDFMHLIQVIITVIVDVTPLQKKMTTNSIHVYNDESWQQLINSYLSHMTKRYKITLASKEKQYYFQS
jgi:hypothetical protein